MPSRRTLTVAGSSVEVLEAGSGPAVLLLHGSGPGTTGRGAWGPTMAALAGHLHLVAPDQAGFGATPVPAAAPESRLRMWTEQAAALMDALGHERYAVVGHSMGGAVALALAAARPAQVTRVVGVSSMGAPGVLPPDLDALWAAQPGLEGARDLLGRLLHDPTRATDAAVRARAEAMLAGAAQFAGLLPPPRQRWYDDLSLSGADLSAVRVPVLLVSGAQDRVTPLVSTALPLLDGLPDARLVVLARCGHALAVEQPQELVRLLGAFLGDGASLAGTV